MRPVVDALRQLGNSGTPSEVREVVAKNLNFTERKRDENKSGPPGPPRPTDPPTDPRPTDPPTDPRPTDPPKDPRPTDPPKDPPKDPRPTDPPKGGDPPLVS
jgi:hypothetical protein